MSKFAVLYKPQKNHSYCIFYKQKPENNPFYSSQSINFFQCILMHNIYFLINNCIKKYTGMFVHATKMKTLQYLLK